MIQTPILHNLSADDLNRYLVAAGDDIKIASVRLVETAAWKGQTFPVDTRLCTVELQSGQFFQQGTDRIGRPVFYFRWAQRESKQYFSVLADFFFWLCDWAFRSLLLFHINILHRSAPDSKLCLGPWRKDVNASLLAILHRFEKSLAALNVQNAATRCTVVVIMEKPQLRSTVAKSGRRECDPENECQSSPGIGSETVTETATVTTMEHREQCRGQDPRLDLEEEYHDHSNTELEKRLVAILSRHYPERLGKALIVPKSRNALSISSGELRVFLPNARTRSKVVLLSCQEDLKRYIDDSELISIVGGKAPVGVSAFVVWRCYIKHVLWRLER